MLTSKLKGLVAANLLLGFALLGRATADELLEYRVYQIADDKEDNLVRRLTGTLGSDCAAEDVGSTFAKLLSDGSVEPDMLGRLWGSGASQRGDDPAVLTIAANQPEMSYLELVETGLYREQRFACPPQLKLQVQAMSGGPVQVELTRSVVLGRAPLPGSTLDAGRPHVSSCNVSLTLHETPGESYAGLARFSGAEYFLFVAAPFGHFSSPSKEETLQFATELKYMRFANDDAAKHEAWQPPITSGTRAAIHPLTPEAFADMNEDPDAILMCAPRITLTDAQVAREKAGEADRTLFKVLLKRPGESFGGGFGQGTGGGGFGSGTSPGIPDPTSGLSVHLTPYAAWMNAEDKKRLTTDALIGGGVIIADVDFPSSPSKADTGLMAILKCTDGGQDGYVDLDLYSVLREAANDDLESQSWHVHTIIRMGSPYIIVPTEQTVEGWDVVVVECHVVQQPERARLFPAR
jgi:hypothetical protein